MVYFQVLRDILKEVQGNMVPRSMLKEWALHTFPNATDYWTFRKMFTIQLALIGLAEFMLHLNRLNPEMLQIAQVRNARKHTQTAMCWTSCEGESEISLTGANSIDIHTLRCINRSPLPSPYQAVWITILPHDIHARPISQPPLSMQRMFWQSVIFSPTAQLSKTFQFEEAMFVCASTHLSAAQGLQAAFSKSLLKMIVSVGHPSPLILIGLCWQAFLRAAKH